LTTLTCIDLSATVGLLPLLVPLVHHRNNRLQHVRIVKQKLWRNPRLDSNLRYKPGY